MYILLLFFIVFNFIIYHKVFRVIYFDLAKGLSKEIFWCILLSPFEAAIVVAVGPYILVALGVILAIVLIVKYVNKKKNTDENVSENFAERANAGDWRKPENIKEDSKQDDRIFCPYCGEKILRVAKFCNFCGQTNSYDK